MVPKFEDKNEHEYENEMQKFMWRYMICFMM